MSFKQLLASSALAFLALNLLPAKAQDMSEARRWGNLMAQAGVRFVTTETCEPGVAASYTPSTRTIELCTNANQSIAQLRETIAHEITHATQHCVARNLGMDGMVPITTGLAQSSPDLASYFMQYVHRYTTAKASDISFSTRYNGRPIALQLEREAYALEAEPEFAFKLFAGACIGR